MSRLVHRNPFARSDVHSEIVYDRDCRWCGGSKKTPSGKKFVYRYRVEHDGGRKEDIRGYYCSVSCMRSHNE